MMRRAGTGGGATYATLEGVRVGDLVAGVVAASERRCTVLVSKFGLIRIRFDLLQ